MGYCDGIFVEFTAKSFLCTKKHENSKKSIILRIFRTLVESAKKIFYR